MTLMQIKYLTAVGETCNISKAANDLFVSRPTVSRTLRSLEEEFGVPLFYRTATGLVLTEEGRFFYERALELQRLCDKLQAQMRMVREKMTPGADRTVKIGITPTTSIIIYPRLYGELKAACPEITPVTAEYSRVYSRKALEEGTIDFHLTADARSETLPKGFRRLELMDNQLVLCMAASHRLAGRPFIMADDIKDEPLIYLTQYFQDENTIDRIYMQKGFKPNIRFRSLQMSTIRELTAAGLGCAILMKGAIDDGKTIVAAPFEPPIPTTICLVWNSGLLHNRAFDEFLSFAYRFKAGLDEEKALNDFERRKN